MDHLPEWRTHCPALHRMLLPTCSYNPRAVGSGEASLTDVELHLPLPESPDQGHTPFYSSDCPYEVVVSVFTLHLRSLKPKPKRLELGLKTWATKCLSGRPGHPGSASYSFVSSQPGLHLGVLIKLCNPGGQCTGICGSMPDTVLGKQMWATVLRFS